MCLMGGMIGWESGAGVDGVGGVCCSADRCASVASVHVAGGGGDGDQLSCARDQLSCARDQLSCVLWLV